MAWVWTAVGVTGLVAGLLTLALAALVYWGNPHRTQNRLLASLLALNGGTLLTGWGLMFLTDHPADTYAWQAVGIVLWGPLLPLYVAFLGTLPTPLAPALRRIRPLLWPAALLVPVLWFTRPERFVAGVVPGAFAPWDVLVGPYWANLFYASSAVSILGLVLAIWAFARAPAGTMQRTQAATYLAAFAILDLTSGGVNGYIAVVGGWTVWVAYIQILGSILFVFLVAYGMLRTQLFDIDLKVKWTLRRGTLAGIFLVVFLVVSQFIERIASEKLGYVSGAVAAGLLLFAINPLQRTADKLADKAMPKTDSSPAYLAFRKMEVYKAAVEEVLADGQVSDKDRRVLDRLRTQLGLGASDAGSMERDVAALRGVV